MKGKVKDRKIVVVNQAVNYLTIGMCNAFAERFEEVALITGSVHVQGEVLNDKIQITSINKWVERPASKKMLSYLKASFIIFVLLHTKYRKHEVFFVSVPPMGYLLNLVTFQRFSILIWDVFPDAFKITGMKESHPLYRIWAFLNKYSFKKAFRVYTIGEKMADLLSQYIDRSRLLITPIWSIFQKNTKVAKAENPFIHQHGLEGKFIVQYSGNIGLSHKVELIIEIAKLLKDEAHILFQIIGRGPRMPQLKEEVKKSQLTNCQFLPFQSDDMFPFSLSAADIGVVILDDITSKGSVPSKTYNLMSFGIPTLNIAAQDSELHDYSEKYGYGICIQADQLEKAAAFISQLCKDNKQHQELSGKAVNAAINYRRTNADRIVDLYLKQDH